MTAASANRARRRGTGTQVRTELPGTWKVFGEVQAAGNRTFHIATRRRCLRTRFRSGAGTLLAPGRVSELL